MMIKGDIWWCKMDKAVPKFRPSDGKEYAIECANLDLDTKKRLKEAGMIGRVKNKLDDRNDFIHFTVSEFQRPRREDPLTGEIELWDFDNGSLDDALEEGYSAKANDAPNVVDADGKPWDWKRNAAGNATNLIANGSKGTFKFNVSGKNAYLVAVKVDEHVPYEKNAGDWEDPDDWGEVAPKKSKTEKKLPGKTILEELDDEIPY